MVDRKHVRNADLTIGTALALVLVMTIQLRSILHVAPSSTIAACESIAATARLATATARPVVMTAYASASRLA